MVGEVESKIFECIDNKKSFILDAGAGSGKTWTLIQSLEYLIKNRNAELKRKNQNIICITYTNVAKDEIIERLEHNELIVVSTIHQFLWSFIKRYQKELKKELIEHIEQKINDKNEKLNKVRNKTTKSYQGNLEKKEKYENGLKELKNYNKKINYQEYSSYKNGIISHSDILIFSENLFSKYPLINKIFADCYPIVFIDEYQDTDKKVIKIFLEYLLKEKITIGLFGDKMQNIYDEGIGKIENENLERITKEDNYRCSQSVINLLNKIRNDITQKPSAKNSEIEGSYKFYYKEDSDFNLDSFEENTLRDKYSWNIKDSEFKVLYLTHKLIAKRNNYLKLIELYSEHSNEDYLTKNKNQRGRCAYTDFLFDIENIIDLYKNSKIQELLKKLKDNNDFKLQTLDDKKTLKDILDKLKNERENLTIGEVITLIFDEKLLRKREKMKEFDLNKNKKEFLEKLMKIEYKEFINCYEVQMENTPYSTKHGTKGKEFDNVLVVLEKHKWNKYNFDKYFKNLNNSDMNNDSIYNRTKNLFYVSCSRAKKNLVVLCLDKLGDEAIKNVKSMFGEENFIKLE